MRRFGRNTPSAGDEASDAAQADVQPDDDLGPAPRQLGQISDLAPMPAVPAAAGASAATGATRQEVLSSSISSSANAALAFPYNCVVLIETEDPGNPGFFYEGSGVVIGPHTVLTASHMLWDSTHQSEANQVFLYPAYNQNGIPNPPGSGGPLGASLAWHNFGVGTVGAPTISQSDSQFDYAVIDTNFTFTSWMGVVVNLGAGTVHETGYPASANGIQTDTVGTVSKDPNYALLDYGTLTASPGNSGGPLWLNFNGSDDVAGIVSTGIWACQLTTADWNQIQSWENADSYLWAGPPPVVTSNNQSVATGVQVALSSLFNISGSGITQYKVWFGYPEGGAPALGTLTNGGTSIALDQTVTLTSLGGWVYTGPAAHGTDKIWLAAYNGSWSNGGNWVETDITDPGNVVAPPVVTSKNQSVATGVQAALSSLFNISGSGITQYKVWFGYPEGGAPALGTLTNGGTSIALDQTVTLSSLNGWVYTGPATAGTDKIWLQAYNGSWSNSGAWVETDITDPGGGGPPPGGTAPVVMSKNQSVATGVQVALSSLFNISGSGITQYKVWFGYPEGGAPALGTLTNGGTSIALDQTVTLSSLNGWVYTGPSTSGTDKIWLEAYNGSWSNNGNWVETDITDPGNVVAAPVVTSKNQSVAAGVQVALSSLFNITGSGITQYKVWFSYPEGGAPALGTLTNGSTSIALDQTVTLTSLSGWTYTGPSTPGTDKIWLEAYNGSWSNNGNWVETDITDSGSSSGHGLHINLIADDSVANAPAGFAAAVQTAANLLQQAFSDNVTINIRYGWGTYNNTVDSKLTGAASAEGGFLAGDYVPYATAKSWLTAHGSSSQDATAYANLPASSSSFPGSPADVTVSSAQEKTLGHFTGSASTVDGAIGIGTGWTNSSSWVAAALHEITHAMGRVSGYASSYGAPTIEDMFRYSAAHQYQWTGGQPAYFSIDGGNTHLADFSTTSDFGDWAINSLTPNDPFNWAVSSGSNALTAGDVTTMDVIGFNRAAGAAGAATSAIDTSAGATDLVFSGQDIEPPAGPVSLGQLGADAAAQTALVYAGTSGMAEAGSNLALLRDDAAAHAAPAGDGVVAAGPEQASLLGQMSLAVAPPHA
jgi:V8-like Glu-specific endopeptidase